MPRLSFSTHINASPERVFAAFTDFENSPQRITAIKRVEVIPDGPIGRGTRIRETRVMFKREATETMEITEFDPPRACALEANTCGSQWRTGFHFVGEGPDRTRIDLEMVIKPVSLLAKIMSPLSVLMLGQMRKCVEQDLADLGRYVESQAGQDGEVGAVVASGLSG